MQRLFFSLKFTSAQQQQLLPYQQQALSLSADARPTDNDNLHLTLFFLGQTSAEQQQHLLFEASNISVPAFRLTLDYLACFAKPKILYLAPSVIPAELLALQQQLATMCKKAGFVELHPYYRPHITLARHAVCPADLQQTVAPLTLDIAQFALYHSTQQQDRLCYLPQTVFKLV